MSACWTLACGPRARFRAAAAIQPAVPAQPGVTHLHRSFSGPSRLDFKNPIVVGTLSQAFFPELMAMLVEVPDNTVTAKLTTVVADLAYAIDKAWTFSLGYMYEKYDFADAFTSGASNFPQSVLFFLKANDGGYKANVAFAKLNFRF